MFILKTLIDKYCSKKGGKLFAYFVDFFAKLSILLYMLLQNLNYCKLVLEQNFTKLSSLCMQIVNSAYA